MIVLCISYIVFMFIKKFYMNFSLICFKTENFPLYAVDDRIEVVSHEVGDF